MSNSTPSSPRNNIVVTDPSSPGTIEKGELHSRKSKKSSSPQRLLNGKSTSTTKQSSHNNNAFIKYGSLLLLVGQMVGLVLLMRYTRTHTDGGDLYLASTAVFMMEVMKFCICLGVVFYQTGNLTAELHKHIIDSPNEMIKLCVPSLLYTIQNNLLYLALTNLDAATYQILYQLKILTTAVFSALILGRRFSTTKWTSLFVLTVGVAIVQVSGSSDHHDASEDRNRFIGLVAVLCATCTSGFSGVYFESILKGSEITLWVRNIQMGISSMIVALMTCYLEDSVAISAKGFFQGYSPMVVSVIIVQAVGGLIVAVVVKYADNVLKVFATSFSIILSCIISAFAFDFRPNLLFVVGASLVVASTVMYSKPANINKKKRRQALPVTGTRKTSLVM